MDHTILTKENYFQYFKYTIYLLLTLNFYFFFIEDLAAFSVRYSDSISFSEIITAYSASIDTIAWLILLWILEFETYILDDNYNKTKKVLKKFNKEDDLYYWFKIKKESLIISKELSDEESLNFINDSFKKIKYPSIKMIFDIANP